MKALNVLLKVWSNAENVDYALIALSQKYALRLLEKVKLARELKARWSHFHELVFFEYGPVLFAERDDLLGQGKTDELEIEERMVLDEPIFIPTDSQTSPDYVVLKAFSDEIHWEGTLRHVDAKWETAAIPLSVLEEAAGVRIEGLPCGEEM
jgi:hypothetical protein